MTTTSLTTLQTIAAKIFDKLKKTGPEAFPFGEADMYWVVSSPQCYDLSAEPALEVGSLNDDLASLHALLRDPDREVSFVDLDRFASVLRAISHALNPPRESTSC